MKFPLGAMTVGDVLDRGLRLLLGRFPTFLLIYLIVELPLLAYQLLVLPQIYTGNIENLIMTILVSTLGVFLLFAILLIIGSGAIVYVVAQEYIGRRVGVGEAMSMGLSRFGALFGTSILTGLMLFLGVLACFFPVFIFMVWYAFVAQVVVMEGKSGSAAMSRSKELGTGYGGRIFGMILLLGIISGILNGAAGLLNLVLPGMETIPSKEGFPIYRIVNYTNYAINTVFAFVVSVIATGYQAVCTTLLYLDLRIRKEGFDLEVAAHQLSGGEPAGGATAGPAQEQW